ncbi:carbohydrate esterase family 16 protein [Macrolepiota fuliginosa MF-IS2]|uniref:Carbohydrate esterase family 16 protein n=1 Tax=Macrolepiota fuliginosa MF-IS2 TaxID=1400762 RepID=A0A9P6C0T3_9AGAR|nr:carbohydrate esterase family 16 protein [Macrolepiota fuliginosa MF-IS2]
MTPIPKLATAIIAIWTSIPTSSASLTGIRNVFAFYTTNGWGGTGDPLAAHSAVCFSAGPPWSQQFAQITGTRLIDLAVSGATADQSLIFTSPLDFRGQTTAFLQQVVPFPNKVAWNSTDSLFTVSFGTNDVNQSFKNTTGNGTDLYAQDLTSYFATVDRLYTAGARKFVFNNVVPFDRAQIGVGQGPQLDEKMKDSILEFNAQLAAKAAAYCATKTDITTCLVFDTHMVFTNLMDNFASFGFATSDQFCPSYANRFSCDVDPTVDSTCLGPISVYIWKDSLHPSFAADTFWAQGLADQLQ